MPLAIVRQDITNEVLFACGQPLPGSQSARKPLFCGGGACL